MVHSKFLVSKVTHLTKRLATPVIMERLLNETQQIKLRLFIRKIDKKEQRTYKKN